MAMESEIANLTNGWHQVTLSSNSQMLNVRRVRVDKRSQPMKISFKIDEIEYGIVRLMMKT